MKPQEWDGNLATLPDGGSLRRLEYFAVDTRSNVVLVGDRFNASEDERYVPCLWTRLRLGSHLWGSSREKLVKLGLRWRFSANLLPGHPGAGYRHPEDDANGRKMAIELLRFAMTNELRLVILGNFAASCFNMGLMEEKHGTLFTIHHPSGRSRWWNSPVNVRVTKEFIQRHKLD